MAANSSSDAYGVDSQLIKLNHLLHTAQVIQHMLLHISQLSFLQPFRLGWLLLFAMPVFST